MSSKPVAPQRRFQLSDEVLDLSAVTYFFPKTKYEALGGLVLPIKNLGERDGEPAFVDVRVRDVCLALEAAGKHHDAEWWRGLNVGMTAMEGWHSENDPIVSFPASQGVVLEV